MGVAKHENSWRKGLAFLSRETTYTYFIGDISVVIFMESAIQSGDFYHAKIPNLHDLESNDLT